jgi:uncharacterized protein (DUF433 family)
MEIHRPEETASRMEESSLQDRIVMTPGVRGGEPRIAGHRITVSDVAIWFERMGSVPGCEASAFARRR